jgi:hypothetical protein
MATVQTSEAGATMEQNQYKAPFLWKSHFSTRYDGFELNTFVTWFYIALLSSNAS